MVYSGADTTVPLFPFFFFCLTERNEQTTTALYSPLVTGCRSMLCSNLEGENAELAATFWPAKYLPTWTSMSKLASVLCKFNE